MKPVEVVTFGCRLNAYESELMRQAAEAAGCGNTVVFNTCAVTGEALRQARQAIRRARRDSPGARLIAAGCGVEIAPEAFAGMPEVDRVLGNRQKLDSGFYRPSAPRVAVGPGTSVAGPSPRVEHFRFHSRAFLEVQNGCDHRCTFCIIPFARGPSRSVPVAEVVANARRLVGSGYNEIVLTGVDITDYGKDLDGKPSLGRLVRTLLLEVPELPRLRLSSIDSVEADDELFRAFAEHERLMPHIHLSLQSGDDLILKRMKRRHRRADAIAFCRRMREARSDIAFGADVICGFPTETDAMFARSLDLADDCGLTYLHVFPFSPRPGTPAARMPQVAPPVARDRAARLRRHGERRLRAFLADEVGKTRRILVERGNRGHTEHHAAVRFREDVMPGRIVNAVILRAGDDHLEARVGA
ncbi:MAG TPA: tRNA (N(6)-L-threonylcarbamoyladenosine(37)-C(2))-methylthiotransferase MtaB [Aestuariivirgaceae bacterium]|nr:tRNA (N(6)-L-threonylcarbamoyladenosine(37)-C(2))-methylthiotransferase MtaB [Aestuariivirgaceae bacterium]